MNAPRRNGRPDEDGERGRPMRRVMVWIGPAAAAVAWATASARGLTPEAARTLAVIVWCAVWWVSEAVPIAVTSLLPLAILPLAGVLTPTEVGAAYGSPLILLLMGGFLLSTSMEGSGAHRRIALTMVRACGGSSGRRLVIGFMLAAGLLAMWISNTATTLMLLPVVLGVTSRVDDERVVTALLLGVAYAASIGGVATPVGTPPNLVFMEVYGETTGAELSFLEWMRWGLPIASAMWLAAAAWLTRGLGGRLEVDLPEVGPWRAAEVRTLAVFAATALLWVTRREPLGGWSGWLDLPAANDASVALLAVVVLAVLPDGRGGRLLEWERAERIPWGVLILFGGGVAIAKAFTASGLGEAAAAGLSGLGGLPVVVLVGSVCLAVTFLTEVTSNTATATLLMPVLAATAVAIDIEPAVVMVPATVSASFAFMLPVATAPNAIVFGTGRLTVGRMARTGIVLNLVGVAVVTAAAWATRG
ncbi:MAG: SLC13 family permease [Planctomycetota bacterium]